MEGGRGRQQPMCNPSVILLTLCLLSSVIGWQMGRRHGAAEQDAVAPVCPPSLAEGDAAAGLAASDGDVVRVSHVDLLQWQGRLAGAGTRL